MIYVYVGIWSYVFLSCPLSLSFSLPSSAPNHPQLIAISGSVISLLICEMQNLKCGNNDVTVEISCESSDVKLCREMGANLFGFIPF